MRLFVILLLLAEPLPRFPHGTSDKHSQLNVCVGENVTLPCTACLPNADVGWRYHKPNGSSPTGSSSEYVYVNGQIYKRYNKTCYMIIWGHSKAIKSSILLPATSFLVQCMQSPTTATRERSDTATEAEVSSAFLITVLAFILGVTFILPLYVRYIWSRNCHRTGKNESYISDDYHHEDELPPLIKQCSESPTTALLERPDTTTGEHISNCPVVNFKTTNYYIPVIFDFRNHNRMTTPPVLQIPLTAQNITDLPKEIREIILMKAAHKAVKEVKRGTANIPHEVLVRLYRSFGGVAFQLLQRKWIRKQLHSEFARICYPYFWNPKWQELLRQDKVAGIAALGDRIYIISKLSDEIQVFTSSGLYTESILIEGMEYPNDIVGCPDSGRLFVAGSTCLYIVQLAFREAAVTREDASTTIIGLSVGNGRVLATLGETLMLFGVYGCEPKDVIECGVSALHAVETKSETFMICCAGVDIGGIHEIDFNGHIIRSCNESINLPYHLALDGDGRVFVADRQNGRVLLLSSSLQVERTLLSVEHSSPSRICFNGSYLWLVRNVPGRDQNYAGCTAVFAVKLLTNTCGPAPRHGKASVEID